MRDETFSTREGWGRDARDEDDAVLGAAPMDDLDDEWQGAAHQQTAESGGASALCQSGGGGHAHDTAGGLRQPSYT